MILATAWNNGKYHPSGSGYGLRVSAADRDRYFERAWRSVELRIDAARPIIVNIDKPSFWHGYRELISVELGRWMLANQFAPWPKGQPPRFSLIPQGPGAFEIRTPGGLSLGHLAPN
jgi:hypothetical protein